MFIVRFFQMGGFFMFPILLVLAVGIQSRSSAGFI